MKKIISFAFLGLLVMALASCTQNTPSATVEKALNCLQNEDYEGFVDQLYRNEKDMKGDVAKQKEETVSLLKAKYANNADKKIKDFKILGEELINDSTAKVTAELEYGNGESEVEEFTCLTDKNGDWKYKMTK